MRKGNIVKWDGGLWVVSEWVENAVGMKYKTRCHLISFEHSNHSATLTDAPLHKSFHIENVKFADSSGMEFITNRLKKLLKNTP